jgi:hypothetical protein
MGLISFIIRSVSEVDASTLPRAERPNRDPTAEEEVERRNWPDCRS